MKLEIKKFKVFKDKTGDLIPFYLGKHFNNFKIKRFFFIHGSNKYLRANHAHKKCNQIIIPVNGSVDIEVTTKQNKKLIFKLSQKNCNYLIIPKLHWIRIKFKEKKASVITLCDFKYSEKEYIRDINKFLSLK
tara:strand:+ start:218 stop:616 length:399 start_codon:yes stop_codon:yes gene_type:complete